jgi:hypothetical protein
MYKIGDCSILHSGMLGSLIPGNRIAIAIHGDSLSLILGCSTAGHGQWRERVPLISKQEQIKKWALDCRKLN